jgi:predicted RNA-binding protein YlqC (UPF0109 family)
MSEGRVSELIEYIAKALVDHPEEVQVEEIAGARSIIFELHVAPSDMGRVIGKHGRVANAIRSLLRVASTRSGKRAILEIVE